MASNPTSSRKPRRRNWASEIARQEHSKSRRRLARQAAERTAREEQNARAALNDAQSRLTYKEVNRRINSVANGLRPRLIAVMNSWGLNLPVELTSSHRLSAWTDFKNIHIEYASDVAAQYSRSSGKSVSESPLRTEVQRIMAAEIRGLFYHEVGHNLATVPLPNLLALAARSGWTSATDGVELTGNDPADPASWSALNDFRIAWNSLEDARMEAWLVAESPQVAAYLTVVVLERMMGRQTLEHSWPLVAGRHYLPTRVRTESRAAFAWPDLADQVEQIVTRYTRASTAVEMIKAVEEFFSLTRRLQKDGFRPENGQVDTHRNTWRPDDDLENVILETGQKIDQASDEQNGSGGVGGASDEDEEDEGGSGLGDEDGSGLGDEDGDESRAAVYSDEECSGSGGSGVGRGSDRRTGNERIRETASQRALDDTIDSLSNDQTLTDDVAAINDAYHTDDGALPVYSGQHENGSEKLVSEAHAVVDDIVRAFELVTADCAPTWQSQQRRGALEAIRYRTRQPGDLEIFRAYEDHGDPGHDIAVSLFLDISGSMAGTQDMLGATAWAVKTACDTLDIECDVTLFDHFGYRLWGVADRVPPVVPSLVPRGGTDPTGAFSAILEEQRPHKHHLVLVMTDGAWNDPLSLVPFTHSNVYSMLFYYGGSYRRPGVTVDYAMAECHRVNEAYYIDDLAAIPKALEHLLMSLV